MTPQHCCQAILSTLPSAPHSDWVVTLGWWGRVMTQWQFTSPLSSHSWLEESCCCMSHAAVWGLILLIHTSEHNNTFYIQKVTEHLEQITSYKSQLKDSLKFFENLLCSTLGVTVSVSPFKTHKFRQNLFQQVIKHKWDSVWHNYAINWCYCIILWHYYKLWKCDSCDNDTRWLEVNMSVHVFTLTSTTDLRCSRDTDLYLSVVVWHNHLSVCFSFPSLKPRAVHWMSTTNLWKCTYCSLLYVYATLWVQAWSCFMTTQWLNTQ